MEIEHSAYKENMSTVSWWILDDVTEDAISLEEGVVYAQCRFQLLHHWLEAITILCRDGVSYFIALSCFIIPSCWTTSNGSSPENYKFSCTKTVYSLPTKEERTMLSTEIKYHNIKLRKYGADQAKFIFVTFKCCLRVDSIKSTYWSGVYCFWVLDESK